MESNVIGIEKRHRLRNSTVKRENPREAAALLKRTWAGHVARLGSTEWAIIITERCTKDRNADLEDDGETI